MQTQNVSVRHIVSG